MKKPKKPIIYYYIIVVVALLLLNAFIFPSLKPEIIEVEYSTFLNDLETKAIRKVEVESSQIAYVKLDENNKEVKHITGQMYDPDLVNRLLEANIPFGSVIPKEMSPLVIFIVSWIIPIALIVLVGRYLTRNLQGKMGGNSMSFGKSNAKVYVKAQTGKTFADVAGQEEAKEALTEIVDFLHTPSRYSEIGASLPKGALLVGPPGTGKTLLAQAVAGEADVPFFSISGSEFVEMFVGMGAARVRDLFKQAQEKAPCIIFIDEIDAIGKRRDSSGIGGNDEREQTLNQLLAEMDGFDGSTGVVLLAATNRPETLDKALLRPGRFDRRIPVELPDLKGREAILKVHGKKVKLAYNIDYNAIARATSGASGADLANIINEAALRAVRNNRKQVMQEDLEESVEVILAGYQRKNAGISANEKLIVSYHEIGHALVAAKQKNSAPVHKITIIPRTSGALGYTMQIEEDEKFLMSKEELFTRIVTLTGGRAAEDVIFNSITTGASNDIEQATKLARAMISRYGMSDTFGMTALETVNNPYLGGDTTLACSQEVAAAVDREVIDLIKKAYETAKDILKNNMSKLHELSEYLLENETISGEEFMDILENQAVKYSI